MSNEKKVLMKIEHLTKEFEIKSKKLGGKPQILHALNDVSVDIYEGETLGVIGESGCGKSTFGRTLIQLHKATAGSVTFDGKGCPDGFPGSLLFIGSEKDSRQIDRGTADRA